MRTLAHAAEERIQKGFEHRMAKLRRWFYGESGEEVCPCCFSTLISIRFTKGWESLFCCECGAEGPLPIQGVRCFASKAKAQRIAHIRKLGRIPLRKRQRAYAPNVAW